MKVNCLIRQESLFETRILKRLADPIFLTPEKFPEFQQFPLLLFGEWHDGGFVQGIQWLCANVFRLTFPCIILPPFDQCALSEILGLKVAIDIQGLNTNQLDTHDEEIIFHSGQREFQIQADTGFVGPAGQTLLLATASETPVMVSVQPKNTATPLILCGARLLSSSGLSDNADRKALFNGIIAWADAWHKRSAVSKSKGVKDDKKHEISKETLHLLSVIIAGAGIVNPQEITALASSIFGISLTPEDISAGLSNLSQKRVMAMEEGQISICEKSLERYVQDMGLWSHVRILRKEFRR